MSTSTETVVAITKQIESGKVDQAATALGQVSAGSESPADMSFLNGYIKEASLDRSGAYEAYEAALDSDPQHSGALFRAALLCDQAGDDEKAIELYERCTEGRPAPVNAFLNLALLYEENGALRKADTCLSGVLAEHPNNRKARRLLRSVKSSYTMRYDEQTQMERELHSAVLDMPISDFELSVRSRNCLRQMSIRTLGDLLRTSEAELLAYKNFGETSLSEIKAMLTQKGLRLGQGLAPVPGPVAIPALGSLPVAEPGSTEASAYADRSVAELELSMRSRKALQRLGVSTLGELLQRSEIELLSIKNFGQTSLVEIKRQLEKYGLSFRQPGA